MSIEKYNDNPFTELIHLIDTLFQTVFLIIVLLPSSQQSVIIGDVMIPDTHGTISSSQIVHDTMFITIFKNYEKRLEQRGQHLFLGKMSENVLHFCSFA